MATFRSVLMIHPIQQRSFALVRPPPRHWSSADRIPAVSGSCEVVDVGRRCCLHQREEPPAHPAAGAPTGEHDRSSPPPRPAQTPSPPSHPPPPHTLSLP